jgi:hypothetical protein
MLNALELTSLFLQFVLRFLYSLFSTNMEINSFRYIAMSTFFFVLKNCHFHISSHGLNYTLMHGYINFDAAEIIGRSTSRGIKERIDGRKYYEAT